MSMHDPVRTAATGLTLALLLIGGAGPADAQRDPFAPPPQEEAPERERPREARPEAREEEAPPDPEALLEEAEAAAGGEAQATGEDGLTDEERERLLAQASYRFTKHDDDAAIDIHYYEPTGCYLHEKDGILTDNHCLERAARSLHNRAEGDSEGEGSGGD